jgi:exodeoxyribonuclease V alpha subunit
VEVGSVLAELARTRAVRQPPSPSQVVSSRQLSLFGAPAASAPAPLASSLLHLGGNHRTGVESGLPKVLDAVRASDPAGLEAALADGRGIEWLPQPLQRDRALAHALAWYEPTIRATDPAVALAAFEDARVLVALRSGPEGVDGWNRELMRGLGLADARGPWPVPGAPRRGTPLIVTRNDANTGLSNGDVVLAWGARAGQPADHVLARGPDGSLRRVPLDLLPPCEPALAMTVHKAQGSEYRRVLVAPPFEPHPLVTREWLYTAFSRARDALVVLGGAATLAAGLATSSRRMSGLSDALAATGREPR